MDTEFLNLWWAFVVACALITLAPGPDNLMVISLGMSRGRLAGMVFGAGCALGCLNHTLVAVLGVGALITATPWAFTLLKVAGGAYLIYLGILAWRHAQPIAALQAPEAADIGAWRSLFWKGLLANALNPKVIVFFLAFLPQFASPRYGSLPLQMALLGLTFTAVALLIFGTMGWAAGGLGQWLQRHASAGVWLDRLAAAVFIVLGVRLWWVT